jgi:vacuolar-type H+-ATPase subunit E/Vma4
MALNDILDAIVGDADKRIAEAAASHKQHMKEMREESERKLSRKRTQITEQRDQKKRQLREKAESHARMTRSKSVLAAKRRHMDSLYDTVFDLLKNMPKDKTEKFLELCLKQVTSSGVIRPAKAHEAIIKKMLPKGCELGSAIEASGGFRFESDTTEQDFTYEFLVGQLLRPATEVRAGSELFPVHD